MSERFGGLDDRDELFKLLATEVEEFLLALEASEEALFAFVHNRVAFLNESGLSDEAKALLLDSNYSRVHDVMKHRESQPLRWVCVWVI